MKKPIIIKTIKHVDYEMALIVAGEIINRESEQKWNFAIAAPLAKKEVFCDYIGINAIKHEDANSITIEILDVDVLSTDDNGEPQRYTVDEWIFQKRKTAGFCWSVVCESCGSKNSEIARLTAENAELRARLDKTVEVENKINNGELVGAIWFKSWLNGQICCGRVIGYDDGGFVIESGNDLISAKKIYTSREQAQNGENKNGDDLPF